MEIGFRRHDVHIIFLDYPGGLGGPNVWQITVGEFPLIYKTSYFEKVLWENVLPIVSIEFVAITDQPAF